MNGPTGNRKHRFSRPPRRAARKRAKRNAELAGLVNLTAGEGVQAPGLRRGNESATLPFLPWGSITLIVKLRVTVNCGVNYRPLLCCRNTRGDCGGPRGRRCVAPRGRVQADGVHSVSRQFRTEISPGHPRFSISFRFQLIARASEIRRPRRRSLVPENDPTAIFPQLRTRIASRTRLGPELGVMDKRVRYVISDGNKTYLRAVTEEIMQYPRINPTLHTSRAVTLNPCAPSTPCVEHATCCLTFRGSRPVIGD
ncbi:hypothetical protein PUN28_019794 [Cardiocondyla obscurior]|uniref:Uncharacterized protein n=1 Tax=Cardiocondyla obscurior TaxID=286306 RepID=A0AAW2ED81_9HYME